MPRAPKIINPRSLVNAEYVLSQPKPPAAWIGRAACSQTPLDELPQEARLLAQRNARAVSFIKKYCNYCPVITECGRAVVHEPAKPENVVRGAMDPTATTDLWMAAAAIAREGSVAAAASKAGMDVTGIAPYLPFEPAHNRNLPAAPPSKPHQD